MINNFKGMKNRIVKKVVAPVRKEASDVESLDESLSDEHSEEIEQSFEVDTRQKKAAVSKKAIAAKAKTHSKKSKPEINRSLVDEDSNDERNSETNSEKEEESVDQPVEVVTKVTPKSKKQQEKAQKLCKKIQNRSSKNKDNGSASIIDVEGSLEIQQATVVRKNVYTEYLYYLVSLLTCGLFSLLNHWFNNRVYIWFAYKPTNTFETATHVELLVKNIGKIYRNLNKRKVYITEVFEFDTYIFEHNYALYFLNEQTASFQNLYELAESRINADFSSGLKGGRYESEVAALKSSFGQNVMKIAFKPLVERLRELLFSPLATFEIVAALFLYSNRYVAFAFALICVLFIQLYNEFKESVMKEKKIAESVDFSEKVMVVRRTKDEVYKKKIVDSSDLVIGDLIEITNNLLVPADVAITHGSCVVKEEFDNENSKNKTKVAFGTFGVQSLSDEKIILQAGSQIVYTVTHMSEGCFGIVLRTGFATKRGQALRANLAQNTIKPNKWGHVLLYAFFSVTVIAGITFLLHQKLVLKKKHLDFKKWLDNIVEVFLVFLNPVIPLAFGLVLKQSYDRLRRINIEIFDTSKLKMTGRLRNILLESNVLVAKQKTTAGLILANNNGTDSASFDRLCTSTKKFFKSVTENNIARRFSEAFGLCNFATKVGEEIYGGCAEVEMLKNSAFELRYHLIEKGKTDRFFVPKAEFKDLFAGEYRVKRILNENRSGKSTSFSVVAETSNDEKFFYARCDPNEVERMCTKNSIPYNFHNCVSKYSNKGFKVVAFAFKPLNDEQVNLPFEQLESGLTFLGFYFLNTTVNETCVSTIKSLHASNIGVTYVSDSSVYLAIALARRSEVISPDDKVLLGRTETVNNVEKLYWTLFEPKVGLVAAIQNQSYSNAGDNSLLGEHMNVTELEGGSDFNVLDSTETVALTGNAFNYILESGSDELKTNILPRCKVFGNLTAGDRQKVITGLQGNQTSPVGYVFRRNGRKDAIGQAEVSVALEPKSAISNYVYSSKKPEIETLVRVLEEGRVASANIEQNVNFIITFTALQIFGFAILSSKGVSYGQYHLLFLDLFVLLGFSVLQAKIKPAKINKHVPEKSLLTIKFIFKALILAAVSIASLYLVLWALWKTKFYRSPADILASAKNATAASAFFFEPFAVFITTVFISLQFIVISNKGNFFKKNLFTKFGLTFYWSVVFVFALYLLFAPKLSHRGIHDIFINAFQIPSLFGFEIVILLIWKVVLGALYLGNASRAWIYRSITSKLNAKNALSLENDNQSENDLIVACKDKSLLNDSKLERKAKQQNSKKVSSRHKKIKPVKKEKLSLSRNGGSRLDSGKSESRIEKKEKRVQVKKRQRND
jgi:cation-transporting ATPase 13A2